MVLVWDLVLSLLLIGMGYGVGTGGIGIGWYRSWCCLTIGMSLVLVLISRGCGIGS